MTTARARAPRFRVQDLEALVGRQLGAEDARRWGVTRQAVGEWRRHGVTEERADQLACAENLHPAVVWPTWLEQVVATHAPPRRPRPAALPAPDGADRAASEILGRLLDGASATGGRGR